MVDLHLVLPALNLSNLWHLDFGATSILTQSYSLSFFVGPLLHKKSYWVVEVAYWSLLSTTAPLGIIGFLNLLGFSWGLAQGVLGLRVWGQCLTTADS